MPTAYRPQQKAAIAQFVGFTSTKDSVAAKQLKSHGWNIEQAVDAFFQSSNGGAPNLAATLSKLFDKYRDNPKEEPDKIGVEGSMKYLGDLHVKLDEAVVLAVLTELNAPTMGEFSRGPFIDGWVKNRAETLSKQQAQVATWRRSLSTSPDFFKKVYKQTFILARQQGQRVLPLDVAIEYWRLLFSPPSLSWDTSSTPWLDWWIEYLEEKWTKSINKDMWDQTHNFMVKSREDETMSWWSEDGAWPGVLDDFVVYVKEKRGTPTETEMDIG